MNVARASVWNSGQRKYSFVFTSFSLASARTWAEDILYSRSFLHWYLNAEVVSFNYRGQHPQRIWPAQGRFCLRHLGMSICANNRNVQSWSNNIKRPGQGREPQGATNAFGPMFRERRGGAIVVERLVILLQFSQCLNTIPLIPSLRFTHTWALTVSRGPAATRGWGRSTPRGRL